MTEQQEVEAGDLETCIKVLETIVDNRAVLSSTSEATRRRLLTAAGIISKPTRGERRELAKAFRRKEKNEVRAADEAILDSTGIRALRRAPVFDNPDRATTEAKAPNGPAKVLNEPRNCYICKTDFKEVHFFYDHLCIPCAELNWRKRNQTADLRGRTALVTGARVKIGYQASLMLLRAGARVIVSTRFPNDAALRYARETDFETFRERLVIYGLDLRSTPSVEQFTQALLATESRLDFIVHNACQTVRRPSSFYAHLWETEAAALPSGVAGIVARPRSLELGGPRADEVISSGDVGAGAKVAAGMLSHQPAAPGAFAIRDAMPDDSLAAAFPDGRLDQDLQQVDLRSHNSWRLGLAEVPTVELLEVLLVNAVAPFVISAKLKPLFMRTANRDKHIVNVSAMEGQFYRNFKTEKHPHTNMAKAALNMLTRTSSPDYARDGIYMNSSDTGWVTDEDPAHLADRKRSIHRFHPPLDIVDGAARIVDPIFDGINSGNHQHGLFFKDYVPTKW